MPTISRGAVICILGAGVLVACGGAERPRTLGLDSNRAAATPLDMRPPAGAAQRRLKRAVEALDDRHVEEAILILTDLHAQFPQNGIVLHELALAHRMQHEPARAVAMLSSYRDALPADLLANYGSALDEAGDRRGAEAVFRQGLRKFPSSGLLYSELGTLLVNSGQPERAIVQYELGILGDPHTPSNYYHAAQLLATGHRRGMSLIYGEMFRLLEPDSGRSQHTAALMVKLCRSAVRLATQGDKTNSVASLAPNATAITEKPGFDRTAFERHFELLFGAELAVAQAQGLSLQSLHEARSSFIDALRKPDTPSNLFGHPLLRWLVALGTAGHLEAYDAWLFGPGFPDQWQIWLRRPETAMRLTAMAKYVVAHPLFPRAEEGSPDTI